MIKGIHLQLLMGSISADPVSPELMYALRSVQVTENAAGQGGFQLVFAAGKCSIITRELLPNGFFDPPRRVILVAVVNGTPHVIMDGVITRHELGASGEPGATTLTVTGVDLSQMMDLIDLSGLPWPAMPPEAYVALMLAKYLVYGITPVVIPSVMLCVPNPTERIPHQRGTDLAFVKQLASRVGYVFYIQPGPGVGSSVAYWGPEMKTGEVQPALTVNSDAASNVDALSFSFDGIQKTLFYFYVQEKNSGIPIPLPVPDVTPLSPPLGEKMPMPLHLESLGRLEPNGQDDSTAKLDPLTAMARGLARAAQRADVVGGSGSLDVSRYGTVLRAGKLVGVRGAGVTHDGHYYVKSVTHSIKPGEYKQSFRLTRNALVSSTSEVPV